MATLTPAAQEILDPFRDGLFLCVTKVVVTGSTSDTVTLPEGVRAAGHVSIVAEDTDETSSTVTSITQNAYPAGTTLTIAAGGTAGSTQYILSFHTGSQAGL